MAGQAAELLSSSAGRKLVPGNATVPPAVPTQAKRVSVRYWVRISKFNFKYL